MDRGEFVPPREFKGVESLADREDARERDLETRDHVLEREAQAGQGAEPRFDGWAAPRIGKEFRDRVLAREAAAPGDLRLG